MDPLAVLPAELVLRVLHFASIGSLASLTRASRSWHRFIDLYHQDVIYASKAPGPITSLREPDQYLWDLECYENRADGVRSWKEACRRQSLLSLAWQNMHFPQETVFEPASSSSVWRFKPDFKRRFILFTSHVGGLGVIDMETGRLLWDLPRDNVHEFAHLEYQDGTAVFDARRDSIEVWKTDFPGCPRGVFRRVAVLALDMSICGFQLSHNTLCLASPQGNGSVYDIAPASSEPTLRINFPMDLGSIGHLDQCEDAVLYSMGTRDYHIHDKTSGELLGYIRPRLVGDSHIYHITRRPSDNRRKLEISSQGSHNIKPLARLSLEEGPYPLDDSIYAPMWVENIKYDEWGAGMFNGNSLVGISRGGRLLVCSDWRRALRSDRDFAAVSSIVEFDFMGYDFDAGGCLHVHETAADRTKRVVFETGSDVCVLPLSPEGRLDVEKPVFAIPNKAADTGSRAASVSFMGVYDDCIMHTYAVPSPNTGVRDDHQQPRDDAQLVKGIRLLKFVPAEGFE